MLSRLFSLLFFVLAGWLISRLFGRGRQQPRPRQGPRERLRSEGEMVRDRVCNTFLPRSRAITLHVDGEDRFFCSERCRNTFEEQNAASASAGTGPG